MCEHFRYVSRSVGLLKRGSSLRKVVDRSASRGAMEHMLVPIGPRQFREKSGAYGKSLEVSEILHMGCAIGKSGLVLRPRPADPHYYYTTLRLACQQAICTKKLVVFTTSSTPNRQGCIRLCIPQRSYHPRSSYSKPHRPWFLARSGCTPHNSSTYSSSQSSPSSSYSQGAGQGSS